MRKSSSGFTIIEILVVVAVIAILATISVVSFSRYQIDSRDTQRESRATIIAEALEKYYDENGEYPSCGAVTGSEVTTDVLPGLDVAVLLTPQAGSSETNSIKCEDLVDINDADIFAYVGDGSAACASGDSCLEYTIKYKNEATGTIETLESRRQTDLATSGELGNSFTATIAAGSAGLNRINLTWPSIPNAASYTLERATNSGFTAGLTSVSPSSSSTSYAWTGLTAGTQYFFRIKANASNNTTTWSNTASATTAQLATPVITATPNSLTQITVNWSAITYASSYSLQRATNNSFTSGLVTTSPTGTSSVITGLAAGTTYYFRLQASATGTPGDISNWSATVSAPTPSLATPVITATANSASQITINWSAITYATAYSLQRATNSGFTTGLVTTSPTGTSTTATGLTVGTTYYFRLRASAPADTSDWSNTANATTVLPSPTGVSIAWTNNNGSTSSSASCSIGSPQYSRQTTYRTDGSTADNWGAASAYQTGTTFGDFISGEGMYGKARVNVKCVSGSAESDEVTSSVITNIRPISSISAGTWWNRQTAPALVGVGGSCPSGTTSMYKWGEIYHGSAGYHGGGGWGQWGDFQLTNGPPNWSSNDGINTYRISRTICQTPYWQRSLISAVRGNTLQNCCGDTALSNYNNFVNAGHNWSSAR